MPRHPQQQRSKATVDAIIKAGFICVADKGLANTTTRHIAKVAGVGIGSVYEYFADKDAIYSAMADMFLTDLTKMVAEITPQITEESVENGLRILLNNLRTLLQKEDCLYLRYAQEAGNKQFRESQKMINQVLTDLLMHYLIKHPEIAMAKNIPGVGYFLMHGGSYAIMNHLLDPAPPVSFDQLVDAIAVMTDSYGQVQFGSAQAHAKEN